MRILWLSSGSILHFIAHAKHMKRPRQWYNFHAIEKLSFEYFIRIFEEKNADNNMFGKGQFFQR